MTFRTDTEDNKGANERIAQGHRGLFGGWRGGIYSNASAGLKDSGSHSLQKRGEQAQAVTPPERNEEGSEGLGLPWLFSPYSLRPLPLPCSSWIFPHSASPPV